MNKLTMLANCLLKGLYLFLVLSAAKHFDSKAVLAWFLFVILVDVSGITNKAETKEDSIDAACEETNGTP